MGNWQQLKLKLKISKLSPLLYSRWHNSKHEQAHTSDKNGMSDLFTDDCNKTWKLAKFVQRRCI